MKWVSCSTISDYEAITVSPEEAFAIVEVSSPVGARPAYTGRGDRDPHQRGARASVERHLWEKLRINIRRDWVNGEFRATEVESFQSASGDA